MAARAALLLVLIVSSSAAAQDWTLLTSTSSHTTRSGSVSPTPEATFSIQAVSAVPAATPAATVKSTPAATVKSTPPATVAATPAAATTTKATPAATAVAASPSPTVPAATPLPGGIAVTGNPGISTGSPVAAQTPAAVDSTRTALDAVLRLVGPTLPPFTPEEQAALIVGLSDMTALPPADIAVISYSLTTISKRRRLLTTTAVDVTVELDCSTLDRLSAISKMLSRVTADGTLAANLAGRALPTTDLLLLSTIAVRPGQLSSICVLNDKNTCVDGAAAAKDGRLKLLIGVTVPLAAVTAGTIIIIWVLCRRQKSEEQIRADEKARASTSNSIQIREPSAIKAGDKGKGKVYDYPVDTGVKGKWKWKDDRMLDEYQKSASKFVFARTDNRKTASSETLGIGSSSKEPAGKEKQEKQGWFGKSKSSRPSDKRQTAPTIVEMNAVSASPSKTASFAQKAAAVQAAATASQLPVSVTATSGVIIAMPSPQGSDRSDMSSGSNGSTHSNPLFQIPALTHRTSRLDDLE